MSARSVVGRAVHIQVYPRPRNIAESREILRVLEGYGEVVMYKNLKYEPQAPAPNSLLAIYKHENEAQKLIKASPIKFKSDKSVIYGPRQLDTGNHGSPRATAAFDRGQKIEETRATASHQKPPQSPDPTGDSSTTTTKPDSRSASGPDIESKAPLKDCNGPSATSSASEGLDSEHHQFQLYVSPSAMNHQAYIERQGYYGRFNVDGRSVIAEDLEPRVPLSGLIDLHISKEEVPLRIRMKRAETGSMRALPRLRTLWEEGKRKRAEEDASKASQTMR
ncbi:MAG: hypothetical protein MMC33_000211 [Icmadophila ericetorum]|nr:hypothetical protein [Icmadophila ericetorum]